MITFMNWLKLREDASPDPQLDKDVSNALDTDDPAGNITKAATAAKTRAKQIVTKDPNLGVKVAAKAATVAKLGGSGTLKSTTPMGA